MGTFEGANHPAACHAQLQECGGLKLQFGDWCDQAGEAVGSHNLSILTGRASDLDAARDALADIVPTHFASEERAADILAKLGKKASAKFLENLLPTSSRIRSGDLGEILATEFAPTATSYSLPLKRLRWKDHREMSMRGDDVIGVRDAGTRLEFMKGETKSRAWLGAGTLNEARKGLDRDRGLPSPHALTFTATRLREIGEVGLADKIDLAQYSSGIQQGQVCHLLFVFCGNAPDALMRTNLTAYSGPLNQMYVALRVSSHQDFIAAVYKKVIANANKP